MVCVLVWDSESLVRTRFVQFQITFIDGWFSGLRSMDSCMNCSDALELLKGMMELTFVNFE